MNIITVLVFELKTGYDRRQKTDVDWPTRYTLNIETVTYKHVIIESCIIQTTMLKLGSDQGSNLSSLPTGNFSFVMISSRFRLALSWPKHFETLHFASVTEVARCTD